MRFAVSYWALRLSDSAEKPDFIQQTHRTRVHRRDAIENAPYPIALINPRSSDCTQPTKLLIASIFGVGMPQC